jgi:hypothetical protein
LRACAGDSSQLDFLARSGVSIGSRASTAGIVAGVQWLGVILFFLLGKDGGVYTDDGGWCLELSNGLCRSVTCQRVPHASHVHASWSCACIVLIALMSSLICQNLHV